MWRLRARVLGCLNPSPTTPAWDPVPQFPPLSVGENSTAHVTGLLGESVRKAHGARSGWSGTLLALPQEDQQLGVLGLYDCKQSRDPSSALDQAL